MQLHRFGFTGCCHVYLLCECL
uniref:Uncharacterized protein n=1 Tax=Arundo donax TaxID=35708 RepID=A0A0A9FQ93_ARUDO